MNDINSPATQIESSPRVLKFRTWDTQNKEFSEWTNRDPYFHTSSSQIFFWEKTKKENGSYGADIIICDTGNRFILQQFTGYYDRTGKEIYEGDFIGIKPTMNFRQQIIWKDGAFCRPQVGKEFNFEKHYGMPPNCQGEGNPWLVLGNIFENPELLNAAAS